MRCASCGTENAPDSRFCGGCGARIGASGPRVAPTQKISDDAPFPQRPAAPAPIAHGAAQPSAPRPIPHTPYVSTPPPITTQPGVVPQRPLSAPPAVYSPVATPAPLSPPSSPPSAPPHAPNGMRAATGRPAMPQLDEPAASMPTAARRPWALIIAVLVIDIALASAGAWMLSEGLGDRPSEKPATPPPAASAAPPASPAPSATAGATGGAPAASAPAKTGSNARDLPPPSPAPSPAPSSK
jgi:hypothetical protein